MKLDRKVTIGFLVAVLVQTGGALVWAGAAAERISTLEDTVRERRSVVERLARHAHEARTGKRASVVDDTLVTSLGLQPQAIARLMREIGFRPANNEQGWIWKGRARPRSEAKVDPGHAFAALAKLRRNG